MTIKYQIIHWRDIPVKVRLRVGRTRTVYALSDRFQKTVYRAAYRAKAINGDAYAQGWRTSGWSESAPEQGDEPARVAAGIVATLEAEYNENRLDRLARNKGYELDDPDIQSGRNSIAG